MDPADHTLRVLTEIRDAVRSTNDRVDQTNARLDQTNARLEQTNARLDETNERLEGLGHTLSSRIAESEMRTATALTDLAGGLQKVTATLHDALDLRPRVERCERDITELQHKVL
jgi:methyl-accepting chemotaxis protein